MTVSDEVEGWLAEAWDPELALLEWRRRLAASGWGCPTWPTRWYGRGLAAGEAGAVHAVFRRRGIVGPPAGVGMTLAGPTMLEHGTDELRTAMLERIVTGEDTWCQLFSEPGNGSDLAGLTTHARRDGDEWIVNGQKVWTTSAHHADWGLLLARTDLDVPKHKGITCFALPMRQPGVEVRPLRQMNFHSSFNEVFIDDARIPATHVIGAIGDGWRVAQTTLAHERGLAATALAGSVPPVATGRCAAEARREAEEHARTYIWYPQRAGRPDLLTRRPLADPHHRQQAAAVHALQQAAQWSVERAKAARAAGRPPGPEGSLAKLLGSEIARRSARAHGAMAGAHGMLAGTDPDAPLDGVVAEVLISVPAGSIAGGTDEIQHNIVGERVLGLPREPSVDHDVPFRQVRTNVAPPD